MKGLLFIAALTPGVLAHAQVPADTAVNLLRRLPPPLDLMALPPAYSYQHLGIFCKLDVQLEKHFGIPVFFRLGDARQVEAMEGKGPLAPSSGPLEDR